ncbi:hypothetical protein WICPIJ_001664, partial [Wickerhamomyces pijperi]
RFPEPKERKNAKTPLHANAASNSKTISNNGSTSSRPTEPRKKDPVAAISARTFNIDSTEQKDAFDAMRFFGPSSSVFYILQDKTQDDPYVTLRDSLPPAVTDIMDTAKQGLDATQVEMLKIRGAFRIPEKGLCDDLIRTYFEEIYPVEPLVNKENFMRSYEDGSISLLLLHSVLLAASCVSKNEDLFDKDGSKFNSCSTFFKRAKSVYDSGHETDPIIVIQSLVLFLGYWDGFDDVMSNSYYWTRVAISIAQGFGFHREIDPEVSSLSVGELKTAKLLFWYLYVRDIFTSVGYGRPAMINLDNCDVRMPTKEDFPPDIPELNTKAFVEMLKLSELASIVFNEQYSVRAERLNRKGDSLAINHCDMLMSSWRNSLEPELEYSPQKDMPYAVCVLNLAYYYNVCLVHRALLSKPKMVNGHPYPSEGIVFKASRIIADICAILIKRDELKYCAMYMVSIVFNACTTFVIYKDYGNPVTLASSKTGYDCCFEALRLLGEKYRIAEFMRQCLIKIEKDPNAKKRLLRVLKSQGDGTKKRKKQTETETYDQTPTEGSTAQFQSLANMKRAAKNDFQNSRFSPISSDTGSTGTLSNQSSPIAGKHPLPLREDAGVRSLKRSKPAPGVEKISQLRPPSQSSFNSDSLQSDPLTLQANTSTQAQANQPDIEFPDFYLFTHNLTSTNNQNFDPSELFPNYNQSDLYPTIQTAEQARPISQQLPIVQAPPVPDPTHISFLLHQDPPQHQTMPPPQQQQQQQHQPYMQHHPTNSRDQHQQHQSWQQGQTAPPPPPPHYDMIMDPNINLQELQMNLAASHRMMGFHDQPGSVNQQMQNVQQHQTMFPPPPPPQSQHQQTAPPPAQHHQHHHNGYNHLSGQQVNHNGHNQLPLPPGPQGPPGAPGQLHDQSGMKRSYLPTRDLYR